MDLKLKDRIVLITGASRGLGAATAEQLSAEGAKVIINSRDSIVLHATATRIQAKTGNQVVAIAGDITTADFPAQLIAAVVQQFGGLDILITNAGGPPSGRFESFTDSDWQRAIESNLMSHVRLIRAALPALEKSSCASVLTITSASVKQPIPNLILSNSIRAATVGLTKSLALELGGKNIRVNSILPGWTMTEQNCKNRQMKVL
jgi:3-oxoacyl-[acyl-carrier protein] reductase